MRTPVCALLLALSCSTVLSACTDENGNTAVSTPTGGPVQSVLPSPAAVSPGATPSAVGSPAAAQDDLHAPVPLVTQADGLQTGDFVQGTGPAVQPHQSVTVQYTGWLPGGTVFDTSRKAGGKPITFSLDGVIKGWGEGLVGMKAGGKRRLVIPGPLAYGANPPAGSGIPPNATLTFDVELLSIG